MKTILRFILILLPLFSVISCGVHLEKRLHSKGYYISKNNPIGNIKTFNKSSIKEDVYVSSNIESNSTIEDPIENLTQPKEGIKEGKNTEQSSYLNIKKVLSNNVRADKDRINRKLTFSKILPLNKSAISALKDGETPDEIKQVDDVKMGALFYGVFGLSIVTSLFLLLFMALGSSISGTLILGIVLFGCASALVSIFFLIRSLTHKDLETSIGLSAGFMLAMELVLVALVSLVLAAIYS